MRGGYKCKEVKERNDESSYCGTELCPVQDKQFVVSAESHSPVPGVTFQDVGRKKGTRCSSFSGEKVYLGVRVKMPVKDLLRNVRLAQGWNPHDFQEKYGKTCKVEKKRVATCLSCQTTRRKHHTKSLEELAAIIEVLEEDLKTGNICSPPSQTFSPCDSPVSPEQLPEYNDKFQGSWQQLASYSVQYDAEKHLPRMTDCFMASVETPPNNKSNIYYSSYAISPYQGAGYNSDESDEMIPSPQSNAFSQGKYHQVISPLDTRHSTHLASSYKLYQEEKREGSGGKGEECPSLQYENWSSTSFFCTQLQKEEIRLKNISDAVLLSTDGHGRTILHKVVCLGMRALGYAIAERMSTLNSLNIKDSEGMTALLHAAKNNHHLIVQDLISLGASVSERNNSGKSCLHLSAENGYIRVLEVLKRAMMDGVYIDVEATDKSGMSALQCASVALKATLCELESSKFPSDTRIHMLRKNQMMETLECLLQMTSYLHSMGGGYKENVFEGTYQPVYECSGCQILHKKGEPPYAT
ncbi:NF-kappa-B inhibitor zeta [Thalassophryne amazonica]|uniref:NF-kappa-B inhibitor zeta n=1 Tax=Thalassophryne amazonica TaxID=390379 RepID=UPI0014724855|nr:NF-kappa-B inhibitor zeta [Thalassophryne amazonica]